MVSGLMRKEIALVTLGLGIEAWRIRTTINSERHREMKVAYRI